jgi:serine/threonine protein kinase
MFIDEETGKHIDPKTGALIDPPPYKKEVKREYFSPEKFTFYFFQALSCVSYMHEKSIFYSDMKGANLLIFKNQEVKLGDLGISVKLLDKDIEGTEEQYNGKGVTMGYVTPLYLNSIKEDF